MVKEDEYHIIYKCALYGELRDQLFRDEAFKVANSHNFHIMSDLIYALILGKFIYGAIKLRKNYHNSISL